jgi:hypothetical protein
MRHNAIHESYSVFLLTLLVHAAVHGHPLLLAPGRN